MSVRAELERLYERDGFLTPSQVLAEASEETHPLHSHFEWNDSLAAVKYRLTQAQRLIRVHITVIDNSGEPIRVRAYHSLPVEDDHMAYYSTADIMADAAKRDVVLQQLQRDIAALRRKYKNLLDVDAVLRAAVEAAA